MFGTTAIICNGVVATINGVKLSSPYIISAIGNPESLSGIARPRWIFRRYRIKRCDC